LTRPRAAIVVTGSELVRGDRRDVLGYLNMEGDVRRRMCPRRLDDSLDQIEAAERDGKLTTVRTSGGQRLVPAAEVSRLVSERRAGRAPAAASRRNRR
jgi:hypothetical protein